MGGAFAASRAFPFPAYYPSPEQKTEATAALEAALEHLKADELAAAAEQALRALELVPASATPHIVMGMIAEQDERAEDATGEYREALAWKPDEARAAEALERLEAPGTRASCRFTSNSS